jgi:hypothetical protein
LPDKKELSRIFKPARFLSLYVEAVAAWSGAFNEARHGRRVNVEPNGFAFPLVSTAKKDYQDSC